ncbi:Flp pilus assembly protein TadB [hydrothermal vent metagenome]|uniref:Flp pilus assembly protein TadB n=1 Tax=hydrothermal vent metagenome TaxID=652676 RepID=A0A3B0ZPM3_9ZZZZ
MDNILFYSAIILLAVAAGILAWLGLKAFGKFWEEYQTTFSESTTNSLGDMFMYVDPQRLFLLNIFSIVIFSVFAWLLSHNWIIVIAVALGMLALPWWIYKAIRKRRFKKFEQQLPEALLAIASSLQSGASLPMAFESLVTEQPQPLNQEFELLMRQTRIGVDMETGLSNMEKRLPIPDFIVIVSAIKISREVGGNLIEVMETLAQTLRRKATMEGKIESLTSQGRLQGKVMTGLPILLGVVLMQIEPEAMSKLFTTPIGWGTLAVIVVMEFLGYMTIQKITSIDV